MTVSSDERLGLSRAVSRLRVLFEDDFASLLEGTFGIHVSGRRAGEIEDAGALSLSAHELAARAELVGVVEYLRGEGLGRVESVERLLREAVFTTVNRLLAVRVAEAVGVLPPSLVDGRASVGFVEAVEVFPLVRDADPSGGYWSYLQVCGDELSHAVPRLFDRRQPLSVLEPSAEALDAAVGVLADPELVGVWVEPEALGWSYQFFNTQEERRAMRDASSAPRDSRELAVRNQFFTPSYVVEFLVENTLGRRLRESGSELDLPLLLGEVDGDAPPLDLGGVSVLDPAVGSGHFLLGAYDLLERAWEEQGVLPSEAAPRILGSLFGVDIDARAAQVAQAVLYLRARRSAPDTPLDPPRIVTARALPKDAEVWDEVLADAPALVRDVVTGLGEVLEQAPVLGSLLKPEEYLREAIGERLETPRLGDEALGSFEDVEALVLDAAGRIAAEAASTPAERLFAANTSDALGFVDLMAKRYDTVLMNPPFGEPVAETKDYLKHTWHWIPSKDSNLLAAFVGRGVELSASFGDTGAITSRSGFFLSTFENWRREVVFRNGMPVMADLGFGVMSDATVEAAAYVLSKGRSSGESRFVRLLASSRKGVDLRRAIAAWSENGVSPLVHDIDLETLESLPSGQFAYWIDPGLLRRMIELPAASEAGFVAKQGLITGDDFRFLRSAWEVEPSSLIADPDSIGRWARYAKGGEYSPYFADVHLVVDWQSDGARIRETGRAARVQGVGFYFRPGITWPERTNSAFAPQLLPRGTVFSAVGPFCGHDDRVELLVMLGWMNSRMIKTYIEATAATGEETKTGGVPARHYTVGSVGRLPAPIPIMTDENRDEAAASVEKILAALASARQVDETGATFIAPGTIRQSVGAEYARQEAVALVVLQEQAKLERIFFGSLALTDDSLASLNEIAGPAVWDFPDRGVSELGDAFGSAFSANIGDLIELASGVLGDVRYVKLNYHTADRRLETVSQLVSASPRSVSDARSVAGLIPADRAPTASADLLSYLSGCVFGRWDVRIGRDPSLAPALGDPFDPLPVCPPGMLTGDDGLPVVEVPDGYPVGLPPDRILHDDPGHEWDIVSRMDTAAEFLFDDPDAEVREALGHVKAKDLRSYLRDKFFAHHLKRYSKSRRKAPIYWYLAVPSKRWGLWVYAPWLSREQLFAVARAAQDKMRRLSDEVSQLRRDVEAGEGRVERERLEAAEVLLGEVSEFCEVADSVAQSGWEPDLNDGIILNAAPLVELFADAKWRKDVEVQRKKMISGDYPWATVQTTYYDRLL